MTPPKPPRRRLTEAEWEEALARSVGAPASVRWPDGKPLRTHTGRRRSWWQRGWKR